MKGWEFTIVGRVEADSPEAAKQAIVLVVRQLDNYRPPGFEDRVLITDCGYDVRFFERADHVLDEAGRTTLTGGVHGQSGISGSSAQHDYPALPAAGDDGERDSEAD